MTSSSHQAPTSAALEFAGFVLLHCAAIADGNRQGELICPFAVLWDEYGRRVEAFESETQDEAIEKGWASLVQSQELGEWWAFGREGLSRTPSGALDLLVVSVWTPVQVQPFTVTQGFGRTADQGLVLVGPASVYVGDRSGAEPFEEWDRDALTQGIASHPSGARWPVWKRSVA